MMNRRPRSLRALALVCGVIGLVAAADAPPFAARIDGLGPGAFRRPGEPEAGALVLTSTRAVPSDARVLVRVREFDGAEQVQELAVHLPAGGEARLPLPAGSARLGIRQIEVTVVANDTAAVGDAGTVVVPGRSLVAHATARCAYVLGDPAGAGADPAGFLYGVSAHLMRRADRETQIAAMANIGVRVIRDDASWAALQPTADTWRWEGWDELIALGERHGVEFQIILCYGNPIAATPESRAAFERARAAGDPKAGRILSRSAQADVPWRHFVATMTARYRDRVRLWEVWNEPDLDGFYHGTTDDYLRMLRSAYEEAKRSAPDCLVLCGGMSGVGYHPGRTTNPDMQERVLREGSEAFDIHAYHGHGSFAHFQAGVDGELARMRAQMPHQRPLYFNETALTAARHGEHAQAVALIKKLAFSHLRGAIGYTWYDLCNDGTDPNEGEHNYGLLTHDLQPKPVYAVYNQIVTRLRGLRCIGALDLGPGRYAPVFAGAGRRVVVQWNEDAALADDPVVLRAEGCTVAQLVDLMGNAVAIATRDGVLIAPTGREPRYLELPGGEAMPVVVGPLLAISGDTRVEPGATVSLVATVTNPTRSPLTVDLRWAEGQRSLELPALGSAQVPLDLRCPDDAIPLNRPVAEIAYVVAGGPWAGVVEVPLHVVHVVRGGDDFVLDDASSVISFCEADPALADCLWQGPQDCSARIGLSRIAGALRVRVVVRDDHHVQPYAAKDSWRGDGVQLAFQVPGTAGFWEVGAARADDGSILRAVWVHPDGMDADPAAFQVAITPTTPDGLVYEIDLPYAAFGLSDAVLESGIRFNLIVNDNDGRLREGFLRIAPGIGESKDPAAYPLVRFEAAP